MGAEPGDPEPDALASAEEASTNGGDRLPDVDVNTAAILDDNAAVASAERKNRVEAEPEPSEASQVEVNGRRVTRRTTRRHVTRETIEETVTEEVPLLAYLAEGNLHPAPVG